MTALNEMLATPEMTVDLAGLAARLFVQTVRVRVRGLAGAVADPGLPGRIRGAFGEALKQTASAEAIAGRACPWSPPCAFDALFRNKGRMTPGTDYPNPWVIGVDPDRHDLVASLSVFGAACEWMPVAVEVFTAVLRHRIQWRPEERRPSPSPAIVDRTLVTTDGVEPGAGATALLDFLSPVTVSGRDLADEPRALFAAAGLRLEGIARWHGLSLDGAVDWRAVRQASVALDCWWRDVTPLAWVRGSRRQERAIPMAGVVGGLFAEAPSGDLGEIGVILKIGERVHLGSDIAFGCGRYSLFLS